MADDPGVTTDAHDDDAQFPIVALGASAGGLEALGSFFAHVPAGIGMGFVVVTHLQPDRASLMPELLARHTAMPVREVAAEVAIERDHVYVAPPGAVLDIANGVLHPRPGTAHASPHLPIDHFFRALAHDRGHRAIGIVLSGMGSDGALGLAEIKGASGLTLAQDEASAGYPAMPQSAIATRQVDHVLPPEAMGPRLAEIVRGSYLRAPEHPPTANAAEGSTERVLALVRGRTGHDLSHYKRSTIDRRIARRMAVQRIDSLTGYLQRLADDPAELDALFGEVLVGVTSFFRDPQAFEALASRLPSLLEPHEPGSTVRAWVAGCSTGEEAYSIAILLREAIERVPARHLGLQVFATDIDPRAIATARAGLYPEGILADVDAGRIARYFMVEDGRYRVRKELRESIVFAPHNLLQDPPFTRLDLLVCRNVLIYFEPDLQTRVVPAFYYALRRGGLLFLGSSESVDRFGESFHTVDKRWRIFERGGISPGGGQLLRLPSLLSAHVTPLPPPERRGVEARGLAAVERMLMRQLVPPSVLVRDHGEIVHIHGRVTQFLEPAPGSQSHVSILDMARPGLRAALASALPSAASDGEAWARGVPVTTEGGERQVDVCVRRVDEPGPSSGMLIVTFEQLGRVAGDPTPSPLADSDRVGELELEVTHWKESHESTIQELAIVNEELQTANEELQSSNEELQSSNEELSTTQEEANSLNEELQTLNVELHTKLEELSRANDDIRNLLDRTEIPTLFLDGALHIKRFTEQARKLIRLIPTDVGRSIEDVVSRLEYDTLADDAREVLRTLVPRELEVRARDGAYFLVRMTPYRTTENLIDGLVITFVDVTAFHGAQERERRLVHALARSSVGVFGHDSQLRYTWALGQVLGRPGAEVIGATDEELLGSAAAALVALKRGALASGEAVCTTIRLEVQGHPQLYQLDLAPVRDKDGVVVALDCIATRWVGGEPSA